MSRADGARTKERILECALPLFAEHGFAGTSIRMISSAASVNVATLAYHFEGKEGLYRATVERLHHDLNADWPQDPPTPGADYVAYFVQKGWDFAKSHKTHIRLALRHVLDSERHPDVIYEDWSFMELDRASQVLAMVRPDMDPAERRFVVLSVVHLTVRFLLEDPGQLAAMLGTEDDLDAVVVRYLSNLLKRQLGLPA